MNMILDPRDHDIALAIRTTIEDLRRSVSASQRRAAELRLKGDHTLAAVHDTFAMAREYSAEQFERIEQLCICPPAGGEAHIGINVPGDLWQRAQERLRNVIIDYCEATDSEAVAQAVLDALLEHIHDGINNAVYEMSKGCNMTVLDKAVRRYERLAKKNAAHESGQLQVTSSITQVASAGQGGNI